MTSPGRRPGTSAAERKRRQRQRDQSLSYETEDWRLFTDLGTLPQKAGCQPADLRKVVLKELVDNALDAGATVSLERNENTWIVTDNGSGLDPADVPRLFSVNRPLLSSKLVRLPLRGMLGNGLRVVAGAVAATGGSLMVETRGRRLTLAACRDTGQTHVTSDDPVPPTPGVTIHLWIGPGDSADARLARDSIAIAGCGEAYAGPSSPWWYGGKDLHKLLAQVTPAETTVGALCRSLGYAIDDDRRARSLDRNEAEAILAQLRGQAEPVTPETLGFIGQAYRPTWPGYARKVSVATTQAGAGGDAIGTGALQHADVQEGIARAALDHHEAEAPFGVEALHHGAVLRAGGGDQPPSWGASSSKPRLRDLRSRRQSCVLVIYELADPPLRRSNSESLSSRPELPGREWPAPPPAGSTPRRAVPLDQPRGGCPAPRQTGRRRPGTGHGGP